MRRIALRHPYLCTVLMALLVGHILFFSLEGCSPVFTCYRDAWANYHRSASDWKRVVIYEPGYPTSHAIFVYSDKEGVWGRDYKYDPKFLQGVSVRSTAFELARAFDQRAVVAWFDGGPVVFR